MRTFAQTALNVLLAGAALAFMSVPVASFEGPAQIQIRGRVVDTSDGVLPGVTVSAVSPAGRIVATSVTDGSGTYGFESLPAGPVTLTFELEGFERAKATLTVQADVELVVPVKRLGLATLTDTVQVVAKAPVVEPPPPLPPLPQPVIIPVPEHDQESVCGPAKWGGREAAFGTIVGRRYGSEKGLYAKGDELTIRGGSGNGLAVGQNLAVRRVYRVSEGTGTATGEHTAGLLQIVSTDEDFSTGVVIYACDEMMPGDFLAAVTPEPIRVPDGIGSPDYADAARILFPDAGQMLGVPRRLMVIDRGSDHGIRAGQRLTLFHREGHGTKPAVVGDAVVVAVRPDSATIRIERAIDAIAFGDWAAPQRQLTARQ